MYMLEKQRLAVSICRNPTKDSVECVLSTLTTKAFDWFFISLL